MHWWLLQHLAITALLALLVIALCRVLRLSPATRHLLWLLVLLKLLVPPVVRWPWSVEEIQAQWGRWVQTEPALAATNVPSTTPSPAQPTVPAELDESFAALPPEVLEALLAEQAARTALPPLLAELEPPLLVSADVATAADSDAWFWEWLTLGIWLVGAVAIVSIELVRIARCRRLLQGGRPGPAGLVHLVQQMSAHMALGPPQVRVVPGLGSPMVWTLGKPLLLWPAELLNHFDHEQRRAIVAHELAHLKRRDHWVGRLLLLAEIFWWWNPLFWLVRRELRRTAEWACDAWVVSALPAQRRSYAETLIEVTRVASRAALPTPALGIGGARQAFQRRLTMIMCEHVSCRASRWAILLAGVLALAVLPGWSLAQTPELQQTVEAKQALERLQQSLDKLDQHRKQLEDELAKLRAQLQVLQAAKSQDSAQIATLQENINRYTERLATAQSRNDYAKYIGDLTNAAGALPAEQFLGTVYLQGQTGKRSYGPEQATGAPDCGYVASDNPKAWASKTEDEQDEWLTLAYEPAVQPMAILIYENYNPGALYKVSVFTPGAGDQSLEHEVWKGNDPTPPGSGRGVSLIPVKVSQKITHVKLYLHSPKVKGWNEIDAVGILDADGKIHWAQRAEASTSYADRDGTAGSGATSRALYDSVLRNRMITGDATTSRTLTNVRDQQRLDRLEKDVKEIKDMLQKLLKQQGSSGNPLNEDEEQVLGEKLERKRQ